MAQTCNPLGVSAAIAKALTTQAGLPDAAIKVTDVLVETQLAASSPNILTVSIADPKLQTAASGLLTARKIPKLDKRKGLGVASGNAFPIIDLPLDGGVYRLTDIQGTTDLTQPNLTLEFQSRGACLLRQYLGPLKATREASMTRAEFIAAVIARVTQYHGIPFFCPLLEAIQPIGQKTLTLSEMERMLKLAPGNKHHQGNFSLSGAHAGTKQPEIKASPSGEGSEGDNELDPTLHEEQNHNAKIIMDVARELKADSLVTLAAMETALAESELESKGQVDGPAQGVFQMEPATSAAAHVDPNDVEAAAKWFITQAKEAAKAMPGAQAYELAQAVQRSGAGKASKGAANYGKKRAAAEAIIKNYCGVGGESSTSEKPYEYAISAEEDFWQGINKLSTEVQWYLWFGDGDTLYYWNSLELIQREAIAHIDPINGIIESDIYINRNNGARVKRKRVKRYTSACGLFNYDINIGSEGSSSKGGLTTECTLQIFCQPNFIRAGDVIILTDLTTHGSRKMPWYQNGYSGRWVVINATRSIFNLYTEVTLAIPGTVELLAPVAEPEAQTEASKESEGASSVVDAARRALRLQKNNPGYYQYSEEYNRSTLESLFGGKLPVTVDCSGFATLCYKSAGQPDPNGSGYKPLGNTTTLEAHGRATANPQPGDLAFWSGQAHVAVYVGGGKVISMGQPGDPIETTVAAETALHSGFVGYRTYGSTASAKSTTKAAGDNLLHAVSKRQAEADLRSLAERSPVDDADLLDGGTWETGRRGGAAGEAQATSENEASEGAAHTPGRR